MGGDWIMPTYDYECKKCNLIVEVYKSFTDETAVTCEKCGSDMERKISGGENIVYRGSGWARNQKPNE